MSDRIPDRIAQIIRANPGSSTTAAHTILREFAVLHRSEETIEERGGYFICGSGPEECTARESYNPNWLRNHAANAIALAEYLELVEREQNIRNKRRDELAAEFADGVMGARTDYAGLPTTQRRAIDRIIEIEAAL